MRVQGLLGPDVIERSDSLCARAPVDVLVVDRMADAVRWAAGDRSAYAAGVAYERISIDPNRMSGLPCIRDTRVTVSAILGQLAAGLTIPELLVDFPYLDRADVLAALEFAAAAVQERERELPMAQFRTAGEGSHDAVSGHRD
jgi:uncharacterized protein (DUF433 family)